MKHLYIATPTYDSTVSTGYCTSLALTIAACTKAGIVLSGPDFKGGPYIDVNRNWLVHRFLQSGADALLFIDADVTWDEQAVVELYESGLDMVGGAYPKKEERENYPVKLVEAQLRFADYVYVPGADTYREAQYLPGGFLLVRRGVFERLASKVPSYPALGFAADSGGEVMHAFFQNLHTDKVGFCGEDVYFCVNWRRTGGKCWLAPDIEFGHQGPKEWRGNYARHAVPALEQGEDGTRRAA